MTSGRRQSLQPVSDKTLLLLLSVLPDHRQGRTLPSGGPTSRFGVQATFQDRGTIVTANWIAVQYTVDDSGPTPLSRYRRTTELNLPRMVQPNKRLPSRIIDAQSRKMKKAIFNGVVSVDSEITANYLVLTVPSYPKYQKLPFLPTIKFQTCTIMYLEMEKHRRAATNPPRRYGIPFRVSATWLKLA